MTARVTDPDGLQEVRLRHHLDGNASVGTVIMKDDGTGGDTVAGDGVYAGTLPARASGTLVAFRVEASDARATAATSVFPADAPKHEALVRWGRRCRSAISGSTAFGNAEPDSDRLRNREPLANDNLDCTFVYGDERVVYNAEMRGKGSPWHGGSVGADYIFAMPEGDRLLGAPGPGGRDAREPGQRSQRAARTGRVLDWSPTRRRHPASSPHPFLRKRRLQGTLPRTQRNRTDCTSTTGSRTDGTATCSRSRTGSSSATPATTLSSAGTPRCSASARSATT